MVEIQTPIYKLIKRTFDILASVLLLIVLALPMTVLGLMRNRKPQEAKTDVLTHLAGILKGEFSFFGQSEKTAVQDKETEKTGLKILVVCQHYWPEPYRLPDLCEKLVERGHEVWVITDVPNYPTGRTYPGYRNGKNREELHNGVHIIRTFTIERRKNLLFRFLNYYSFAISSKLRAKRMPPDFDVVLAYQSSPVMMASGAIAYAKKFSKKVVLYCLDLWPASLCVGGIKPSSLIYKIFGLVSKKIYRQADRILVSSRGFEEYLTTNFGIKERKIEYLPQYADGQYLQPYIKEDDSRFNIVFAGNVGTAQNMSVIIDTAELLSDELNVVWHIVGDGSQLDNCKARAEMREIHNIVFHGYKSGEELDACYKMADVMLISMIEDPIISLTLPLKLLSYLAAGKPVIASATGEIAEIVCDAKCGCAVEPGNAEKLASAIKEMMQSAKLDELGNNARSYYDSNFSEKNYIEKMESELSKFSEHTEPVTTV